MMSSVLAALQTLSRTDATNYDSQRENGFIYIQKMLEELTTVARGGVSMGFGPLELTTLGKEVQQGLLTVARSNKATNTLKEGLFSRLQSVTAVLRDVPHCAAAAAATSEELYEILGVRTFERVPFPLLPSFQSLQRLGRVVQWLVLVIALILSMTFASSNALPSGFPQIYGWDGLERVWLSFIWLIWLSN
jgi:hypothetical protein